MKAKCNCCICKKGIETGADASHPLDPCALVIIGHADKEWEEQKEQTFFCHAECFRNMVNNDNIMYIMDDGFGTNGEAAADEEE